MKKKLYAIGTIFALSLSITSCDGLGISDFYSSVELTDADILALGANLEFPELNKIGITSEEDIDISVHNVQTELTDYVEGQGTDETLTTTTDTNVSGSIDSSLYANLSSQEDFYIKGQVTVSDLDISNVVVTNDPDETAVNESTTGSASISAVLRDRSLYMDTTTNITGKIESELDEKESYVPEAEEDGSWDSFELGGTEGLIAQAEAEFLAIVTKLGDAQEVQDILDDPVTQALLAEVEVGVGTDGYQIKLELDPELIETLSTLAESSEATLDEALEDNGPEFSANTLITITLTRGESINTLEVEYLFGFTSTSTYNYINDYNVEYTTTYDSVTTNEVTITGSSSISFVANQPTIPTTFTGYTAMSEDGPAILDILDESGFAN